MPQNGFSLSEFLLACSGVTATGAAFLSLVSGVQSPDGANSSAQVAKAMLIYAADHDEIFPLAMSRRQNGTYRWTEPHPTPANVLTNYELADSHAITAAESFWANSVRAYANDPFNLKDPSQLVKPMPGDRFKADVRPLEVGLTMNGLLHGYQKSGVTNPGLVPLVWAGTGSVAIRGRGASNPVLMCNGKAMGCRFNPRSPAQADATLVDKAAGVMFFLSNSFPDLTIWSKSTGLAQGGGTIANVDGSARFLQWGTAIAPEKTPDATQDPYYQVMFKAGKVEGYEYWASDSPDCSDMSEARKNAANTYPCFFRPDRTK